MRDKKTEYGRALRVSIVVLTAMATAIGVVNELGILRQAFSQRLSSGPSRQHVPVHTKDLANYLRNVDWTRYRQQQLLNPKNAKNARILKQFALTEVNLSAISFDRNSANDETDIAWSPGTAGSSGALIAFSGALAFSATDQNYHLYRMNRDGTSVQQLTQDSNFNPPLRGQREGAWNPQAPNKLVFVAPDPYLPPPSPPYTLNPAVTQTDLYVIDTSRPTSPGINPVRIPLPAGGIKRNPRYLADGITIIFASNTDITAGTANNQTNIPIVNFNLFTCGESGDFFQRTRVTNVAANDTFPAPSVDPSTPMVLFTSDRAGVGFGRHLWGVRLDSSHIANPPFLPPSNIPNPFQVTGTPSLTTNSNFPAEEFQPDWHDPLPAARANVAFFASTRNDGNGGTQTHSSIWSLDMGAVQTNSETLGTAFPIIVSIQPPIPPAGVAPYDPNTARNADNLRPSASHAVNLVGGTDLVAFTSNRQGGSFDIWRSNIQDIVPPVLVPVTIAGASFPVMGPGVPNDAPGTLTRNGSSTPRTLRGGLSNRLTIACVLQEKESGLRDPASLPAPTSHVRVFFRNLDFDRTSPVNPGGGGNPNYFPVCPERTDNNGNPNHVIAEELPAPRVQNAFFDLTPYDDGPPPLGHELQPGAVAGDGTYFCAPAFATGANPSAGTIDIGGSGLNLPTNQEYSIDIEVFDEAANTFTYDNIWGFSLKSFAPRTQLLLVNDYMEGQTFVQNLLASFPNETLSAVPAEGYWTDNPGGDQNRFLNTVTGLGTLFRADTGFDLWRVIARGPVPQDVLAAYVPTRSQQPDPTSTLPLVQRPNVTTLVAEKCAMWGSPFSGNLITGPGTIEDPGMQQSLINNYIGLGGRIMFSGRDIGFALTQNGIQANNFFFTNVLHAVYQSDVGGGPPISPGADRIFNDGPFNHYGAINQNTFDSANPIVSAVLDSLPIPCLTGATPPVNATAGDAWRGGYRINPPFIDSVLPGPGAVQSLNYPNGQAAAVRFQDQSNNSIVAYLAFGFEMVHRGYIDSPTPPGNRCMNVRAKLLHNIACFFRNGFAFGFVVDNNNRPLTPADNIRVELRSGGNIVGVSRLSSDGSGRWEVHGLPPAGGYVVHLVAEDSNFFDHPDLGTSTIHGGFGATTSVNFRLTPASTGSISGVIKDQQGNPIGGICVVAEMIPPTGSGLRVRRGISQPTDQLGRYSIVGLQQGATGTKYRLFYNLKSKNRLTPPPPSPVGDDITFPQGCPSNAFGEALRDDQNAPALGAPDNLPALTPQGPSVAVTSGGDTPVGDTILPQAPGDIAGVVKTTAGSAITATPIRITVTVGTSPSFTNPNPPIIPSPPVPARTDGGNQSPTDGYYEYCGIPANSGTQSYRVTGLALGFGRGTLDVTVIAGRKACRGQIPAPNDPDTLTMPALANPGIVTGQVRRLDDNAAILNATVTLSFLGAGETGAGTVLSSTTSNAQGNYTFNGVFATAAGERFVVQSVKANFTTATSSEFTMAPGQTQTVNLAMDPPGSVSGVIRIASTNAPVPNATVTALDANGNPLLNPDTPGLPFTTTSSAAVNADIRSNNLQFNYRLRDLPPQSIQLRVSASGFSDQVRANINIPVHGEIAGQDILLLPLKVFSQGLQMMSHPFITGGEPVTTTLGVSVGPSAGNAARLARFNTQANAYEEFGTAAFPGNQGFELGRGYFLLLNQSALNITREGASQPTNAPVALATFNGWNMIGYPFAPRGDFANGIDWQTTIVRAFNGGDQSISAAAANGIVRSGLFTYTGNGYSLVSRIIPFGGYWTRVLQSNVTLVINNVPLRSSRVRNEAKLNPFQSLVERGNAEGWAFGLVAQTSKAKDESTLLGTSTTARDDYDRHKAETPPPVQLAPFISVTFPHPEWGSNAGRYAVDIRSPISGEKSWNFEVTSNEPNETVALSWPKLTSSLPRQYRAFLADLDGNQRRYLRTISSYSFTNREANQPRHFRLTITVSSDQRLEVQNVLANPTGSGRVAFSFVLSREADLRVSVLNPAGKPIELSSSRGRAGLNSVVWGGTDQRGNRVPRGVYVLRIQATDPETGQEIQKVKPVTLK